MKGRRSTKAGRSLRKLREERDAEGFATSVSAENGSFMKKTLKLFFRRALKDTNTRFSLILVSFIIALSTILLSINIVGITYDYRIGDIAREDIRSPREIPYPIKEETELKKKRIAEMIPLVFDRDQSILQSRLQRIEKLFIYVSYILRKNPPIGTNDVTFQLIALKEKLPQSLTYDDRVLWELLKHKNPNDLRRTINQILDYIFAKGILSKPYENPLNIKNKNVTIRTINVPEETNEISTKLEDLKTIDEIKKNLYNICYSHSQIKNKYLLSAIYNIVKNNLKPNLTFNIEETKRRIEEGTKAVKPVMGSLKKGEMLIREGDVVTTEALKRIEILNKHTASTNVEYILGVLLLQISVIFITFYFLTEYFSKPIADKKMPVIISSLVLLFLLFSFFISRIENIQNSDLIFALLLPIPLVTMTIAALFSMFPAMLIGMYLIFLSYLFSQADMPTMILAFSSTMLAMFVIRNVERRTDFLRGGFTIGLINSIVVIAVGLMKNYTFYNVVKNIELSFANGIINAIIVMGIFPVYENMFGVTTRFKLLELSDLNAKIFKRMLIKAPGSYNHSLIVANMAEAACEAIGADPILARVGGYYHDIGKIINAKFFVENKTSSKELDIPPREYARLIISHVNDGIELARENKLPESIIDFIKEHHGKSTMTFFYHQALEQAENGGGGEIKVDRGDYEYPGPKPHTKETAVVMIADSIEAASRSLQDPTYVKLEGLVKKIVYNKLNEGELENSGLTMSDLNQIQKAILRVLNGVFHTRIEYPEEDELKKLEEKVMNNLENGN